MCYILHLQCAELSTLCAATVRCGAGAWQGALQLPPADRQVGECVVEHEPVRNLL